MKPLIWTIVVVASHHISIAHIITQAILFVITAVLVVVAISWRFIAIFAIPTQGGPRSWLDAVVFFATTASSV
jgi:hypothetical protein